LKKEYVVATTNVTVWHIDEFSHTLLNGSSIGQYSGDSYIVQWTYSVTITGELFIEQFCEIEELIPKTVLNTSHF